MALGFGPTDESPNHAITCVLHGKGKHSGIAMFGGETITTPPPLSTSEAKYYAGIYDNVRVRRDSVMSRVGRAAAVGLLAGMIGLTLAVVPSVSGLEDMIGLRLLFLARGTVVPPKNITIVNVDEDAATRAGFPRVFRDWPRSTHAALVDRLVERGVSVVAFDVEFFRHGSSAEDDLQFAQSIARAHRVLLVQRIEVANVEGREIWQRRNPIPVLAGAAIGLAPVPVPDVPLVSWFWSFLPTPGLGDVPSLPAVALQLHAMPALGPFLNLLEHAGVDGLDGLPRTAAEIHTAADLLRLMQVIRRQVTANPAAVSTAMTRLRTKDSREGTPEQRETTAALMQLYSGRDTAYLNFYGPPGTICSIAYDRVLALSSDDDAECPLRDAIVFVGLARDRAARGDRPDTYHTVYQSADGVDFSGVELHATAVSNLLTRTALRTPPPPLHFALVLLVGGCLGAGGYWARTRKRWVRGAFPARLHAGVGLTGFAIFYCGVAYVLFRNCSVAIPLVIPVAIQFPAGLILALLVPPARYREQVSAVCLATDAEGSTAVGQHLSNEEYARLIRDYHEALTRPVWNRGGAALAPEGDGFAAVWCGNPVHGVDNDIDSSFRLHACLAAIEIVEAARQFNLTQPDGKRLPVRIGLTVGTVTIQSDADRGVFTAVGDAMNVAARLRDLNREVGSRVLASEDVVTGLETLRLRQPAGDFALKGVACRPVVFEIVGLAIGPDESPTDAAHHQR